MNAADLRIATAEIIADVMGDRASEFLFYTEVRDVCRASGDSVTRWYIYCAPGRDEKFREIMSARGADDALKLFRIRLREFKARQELAT